MMPQIEEAQFVYWGSMRPDVIPLAAPGITMAVGPNGSGKSCWLDGLKIILGVSDLSGRRTPGSYIFNGKPSGVPAEQAWLRATFANPYLPGSAHRVFAVAGPELERTEHVTVVCRVRGDNRRYLFLPGRVSWGADVNAELEELTRAYPDTRWRGPEQYDRLLTRAGVTKSLRGVLALPQGATDRLVAEKSSGLMKRLLELTGRQETLEKFRLAKVEHDKAVIAHREARRRYAMKKTDVERLQVQVGMHRTWAADKARAAEIDQVLLPAARHFDAVSLLDDVKKEIGIKEARTVQLKKDAEEFRNDLGELTEKQDLLAGQLPALRQARETLKRDLTEANTMYGEARARFARACDDLASARALAAGLSLRDVSDRVAEAEVALSEAIYDRQDATERRERSLADRERVGRGGTFAPTVVRSFQDRLRVVGVEAVIVADILEATAVSDDDAAHMRAALGDAVWGVLVPDDQYRSACREATDAGFPWPLVRRGIPGSPGISRTAVPSELHDLFAHLLALPATGMDDVEQLNAAGTDATTADGMRHGSIISRLTPIEDPALEPGARDRVMAMLANSAEQAQYDLSRSESEIASLRAGLERAYALLKAFRTLDSMRQRYRSTCGDAARIRVVCHWLEGESQAFGEEERDLLLEIERVKAVVDKCGGSLAAKEGESGIVANELDELRKKRVVCEINLADNPLPSSYDAAEAAQLKPVQLQADRDRLVKDLSDPTRYPDDVRDPIILSQCDAEEDRLASVEKLIEDKSAEMDRRATLVQNARANYDEHIRAVVRELKARFVDTCLIAGIVGDIKLVPGDVPDEYGVDVLVSHKPGENPVSYQDDSHSGGQGTKISILLLLAAMSLGRTADLLIVDEHKAHLDGANNSQIVEIMRNLGTKVQFVLSAPTNAKDVDQEADWCDVQVAFLPRQPGEAFSPPVRLMSRLGADQLEARFHSLQQPLI